MQLRAHLCAAIRESGNRILSLEWEWECADLEHLARREEQLAGFLWPCARLFLLVKYTQLFFSRGSGDVKAYQSPPTEEGNRFTRGV